MGTKRRGRGSRSGQQRPSGTRGGKPLVAIVGRPNVGKSALFNRLSNTRIAIVEDTPGVTRDRIYADALALGREYVLVDTGGFDPESDDPLSQNIALQVQLALSESDLVVCVLDGAQEPLPADLEAVRMLRQSDRAVLFVANKVDNPRIAHQAVQLYALGLPQLLQVSALHGHGMAELEEAIAQLLPEERHSATAVDPTAPRIAIVGRPNAGKSRLVNRLLGEQRQMVDERPGTTVDSVDTLLTWQGRHFVLIDTAGIRRRRSIQRGVESLSVLQAVRALDRSDVAVLVVDASEGAAEQDTKIVSLAIERGCALVVAVNKVDLMDKRQREKVVRQTRDVLSFAPWAPVCAISALTGQGLKPLLASVAQCGQARCKRVSTAEANRFFEEVLERHPPPTSGGRPVRLYYLTQAGTAPPTFVVVANHPDRVHFSYRRYVANQLRRRFGFEGAPIRVFYRSKRR